MALIKFGAIIVDSRGSIGGMTIKGTRAGPVMQRKAAPVRTLSQLTSINRSRLADLSKDWFNNLDVGQRDDWRALAEANPVPNTWGDEFPLSGIAMFVRVNLTLYSVGETKIFDAPANQSVTALASVTLSVTAPNLAELAFTATPTPANHLLLVNATLKLSPGVNNFTDQFFFLDHGAAGETSPFNLAAAWQEHVGDFKAGAGYAVQATLINAVNGARAAPIVSAVLAG
jgi:hypothetical protein